MDDEHFNGGDNKEENYENENKDFSDDLNSSDGESGYTDYSSSHDNEEDEKYTKDGNFGNYYRDDNQNSGGNYNYGGSGYSGSNGGGVNGGNYNYGGSNYYGNGSNSNYGGNGDNYGNSNNNYGGSNNNNYGGNNNYPYGGGNDVQSGGNAPKTPKKKKNSGLRVFVVIIILIVALVIGLILGFFLNNKDGGGKPNGAEEGTSDESSQNLGNVDDIEAQNSSLGAGEAAEVAEVAKDFNVGILIYQNNKLYTEGSGVIVQEDSDHKYTYIVTCAHVVNYQNVSVSVMLNDGSEYPADVVGLDTRTDLAVVRIEQSGLKCAEVADSDALIVGQTVYAVGNPGGSEFFGSVTNGIISAIDRPINSETGYEMECIQHTAAINPGNSGGALLNGEGKLVGVNSMKIASTDYEGMGFAVPSSVVVKVFNSIIENGYVAGRAKLGITYSAPSDYSQTYAMYVQMKGLPSGTIVVAGVSEDSDLADKDVKEGDMITKVNGKDMTDTGMLSDIIEGMEVGDTLTLTIVRVNPNDWSQTERNVTTKLVEDKGTPATTEDPGNENDPFSGDSGDDFQDWYDYFKQYGF